MLLRRLVLGVAFALGGMPSGHAQTAASYPNKPIRLIVPFGAGGTASFEQAFINRGFADGSPMPANLHCQY